jgi:hypothetical protein
MSKAAHLCRASLERLRDATNAKLTHTCDNGHERCALAPHGPCATEAADLLADPTRDHDAHVTAFASPEFAQVFDPHGTMQRAGLLTIDRPKRPTPKSEHPQQSLF